MKSDNLERWHEAVFKNDSDLLRDLLDNKVEFHSPTVWKPKTGSEVTHFILTNVLDILQDFRYHREWVDGNNMALEFSAKVRDINIKGIDLIKWNSEGKIIHFEVLIRPLNGLQVVFEEMGARVIVESRSYGGEQIRPQ
jgi:hypothetical protein